MEKEIVKEQYNAVSPLYNRAGYNICEALRLFLMESRISYLTISYRVKEFESFFEKIDRKNYSRPFEQNEDFCGIRIIIYYLEDLVKVESIIEKEFDVVSKESKSDKLEINEFGYRSNHLIAKIKKRWLETSNYRNLEEIKVELQIRTVLMHAWAEIEHELGYKNGEQVSAKLKRKLFLISAKLEEADSQFQEIKNEIEDYKNELIAKAEKEGKFSASEFNLDTFTALLEYYFPNHENQVQQKLDLFSTITKLRIGLEQLINYADKILPFVSIIDESIFGKNSKLKTSQSNIMHYAIEVFHQVIDLNYCSVSRKKLIEKIKKM